MKRKEGNFALGFYRIRGKLQLLQTSVNILYHQLIKMKLCLSHYSHKSMPHVKFESGSFSILVYMTSQNFPLKKGTSHRIRIFTPGKWVKLLFKKWVLSPESFFSTQNWPPPHVNFSNFQAEESFSFSKFLRRLKKRSSSPPDWSILLKFSQNMSQR